MVGVTGKKFIQSSLIKTSLAFEKLLAVQDNITLHDRYGWCTL